MSPIEGTQQGTARAVAGVRASRAARRTRRFAVLATVGLAFGGGLAACGSSSSSSTTTSASTAAAKALGSRSRTAMAGLTSFRVSGNIISSGQNTTLDLVLAHTTSGGTFTTSKGSFQLVSDGNQAYLTATQAFWVAQGVPSASAQTLAGKWVTGFPAAQTATLTKSLDVTQLLAPLYKGTVTSLGTSTVDGQKVVGLKASDGSTAYVAATGPPYLLEVASPDNGAQGKVTFSEFGTATPPAVPTGAIDISTISG